ncbi:dephospho-CoA kinase [Nitrosovibrio sp. Nv17]|uniref:dephospho-CoA kinase n=1 Tax=Nitrosovibrio sp. Nv17 TaxID=1855339 RepID=UPI00090904C0|nr:dephospho-CoA kinase [Nitrosovibrio sp. Nv17]SFW11435.1 dephospho-CoA kinase [Nitrosovibrio sp. Nv17]
MSLVVGLTGGIGSGKTTAARLFAELGVDVADADAVSHALTQPQGLAIAPIRRAFPERFITAEGALDRARMRNLVFSDEAARHRLEAILHPLILDQLARQVAAFSAPYGIVVVPLLFETGHYRDMIQRTVVVDCSEREQIARTISRTGLDRQAVLAVVATQMSRQERLQRADDVIANDGGMTCLTRQVHALHRRYLALAGARR